MRSLSICILSVPLDWDILDRSQYIYAERKIERDIYPFLLTNDCDPRPFLLSVLIWAC